MRLTKNFMEFYQDQLVAARKIQEEGKTAMEIEEMHAEAKKNGVDVDVDYSKFNRAQRREMEKTMKRNEKKQRRTLKQNETPEQLDNLNNDDDDNEVMEGIVE